MNKLIVILAVSLLSTSAYATTATSSTAKGFNPTKNVTVSYSDLNNGTVNTAYGVVSQHSQGDKAFASTSAYGGIVSKTTTPGTICTTPPTTPATPTDSSIASDWTQM